MPPEDAPTFIGNARAKACHYARLTGELTVAEDSGLEIEALGGAPGVQSARFGGVSASYPDRFQLLYTALRAKGASGSPARFVCAVALVAGERMLFETTAALEGSIAPEPRGSGGFGYDPIFLYPPDQRTLAEMTAAEKAAISHRGQAFGALRRFLDEITNTSLSLQARLLRVLQEREVRRIGENTARKVEVRIVSATNADLKLLVEAGLVSREQRGKWAYYRLVQPALDAAAAALRPA